MKSNDDSNDNSKTAASKSMTLSEVSSAGVAVSNVKSSSNLSIKLQPSAVNRFKTAATPPKTKSSVSILPVNSADAAPIPAIKKQGPML